MRIMLANLQREVIVSWQRQDIVGTFNFDSLDDNLIVAKDGALRIYRIADGKELVVSMQRAAENVLDACVCVLQLEVDGDDQLTQQRAVLIAAAELALQTGQHQQRLEILQARNNQLIRQQAAMQKEHDQTLESSLRERDARIKEQKSYMDRLEREVAARTMEIKEQTIQLQNANAHMKRSLESAARIQYALLPTALPNRPTVTFSWKFRPCDELAGDSLNVFNLDEDHVGMYVLDVSGHGVPSALLSVTLSRFLMPMTGQSSLLKTSAKEPPYYKLTPPAEVAKQLNHLFPMNESTEQYFTILYGIYNAKSRESRYVSAGHPGLVYCPNDGPPILRETESFAIGWFEDVEYEEHVVQLNPGDRIYMYSDGITESATIEGSAFGEKQLLEEVNNNRATDLDTSVTKLLNRVVNWTGLRSPQDDLSILAFEITPAR